MAVITAQAASENVSAVARICPALSRSHWPRRRANKAETATLVAIKSAKPKNLGCTVRPTAATAVLPRLLTIRVSIILASATKKLSSTAGHAMRRVSRIKLGGCAALLCMKYASFPWALRPEIL